MISPDFINASTFLGELVLLKKSALGTCSVRQQENLRWLLINDTMQSICNIEHPGFFLLPHLIQLETVWKTLKAPTQVLEIGLGGGAIRNYLMHHHPDCNVTTIEKNQDVIDIYQAHFASSQDNALIAADITDIELESKYEWIILDLFSQQACPIFLFQENFYQKLAAAFNKNDESHLFINFICESEQQLAQLKLILTKVLACTSKIYSVQNYSNKIIHLHF